MRSEAYREGYQAQRDGEAQQENPYQREHRNWSEWETGWLDARYAEYQRTHDDDHV